MFSRGRRIRPSSVGRKTSARRVKFSIGQRCEDIVGAVKGGVPPDRNGRPSVVHRRNLFTDLVPKIDNVARGVAGIHRVDEGKAGVFRSEGQSCRISAPELARVEDPLEIGTRFHLGDGPIVWRTRTQACHLHLCRTKN